MDQGNTENQPRKVTRRTFLALVGAALATLITDPTKVGEASEEFFEPKTAIGIRYSDDQIPGLNYQTVPWEIKGRDAKFAARIQEAMAKTAEQLINMGVPRATVIRKMAQVKISQLATSSISGIYSGGRIGLSASEANNEHVVVPHEFHHHFYLVGPDNNPQNNIILGLTEGASEAFWHSVNKTNPNPTNISVSTTPGKFDNNDYEIAALEFQKLANKLDSTPQNTKTPLTFVAFCVQTYEEWQHSGTNIADKQYKPMPISYLLEKAREKYGDIVDEIANTPVFTKEIEPVKI